VRTSWRAMLMRTGKCGLLARSSSPFSIAARVQRSTDGGPPKVSLPFPYDLGGGIKFCETPDKPEDPCGSDANDTGYDINFGMGKYLGMSLGSDGKFCVNIGPGIGPPINISPNSGTMW
jgi:hypothetical protein